MSEITRRSFVKKSTAASAVAANAALLNGLINASASAGEGEETGAETTQPGSTGPTPERSTGEEWRFDGSFTAKINTAVYNMGTPPTQDPGQIAAALNANPEMLSGIEKLGQSGSKATSKTHGYFTTQPSHEDTYWSGQCSTPLTSSDIMNVSLAGDMILFSIVMHYRTWRTSVYSPASFGEYTTCQPDPATFDSLWP